MRIKLITYLAGFLIVSTFGYFSLTHFKLIQGFTLKDIFGSKDVKIEDTQIDIKEVREIGSLITAEYYGEVYADLQESYAGILDKYPPEKFLLYKDSLLDAFPGINQAIRYQSEISGIVEDFTKKKSVFSQEEAEILKRRTEFGEKEKGYRLAESGFNQKKTEFENKQAAFEKSKKNFQTKSSDLKGFLGLNKKQNQEDLNKLNVDFEQAKTQFEQAKTLYEQAKASFTNETDKYKTFKTELSALEKSYDVKKVEFAKEEKKLLDAQRKMTTSADRNLVYIGRGWVKVGFDLQKLKDDDIKAFHDTLLVNLPPIEIINKDINPWFIENKVKGYELYMQKGNNFTNQEVKAVKSMCLRKLVDQAYHKKVIQKGEESGLMAVENFFKLMGFKNVKVFIKRKIDVEQNMALQTKEAKKDSLKIKEDSANVLQ